MCHLISFLCTFTANKNVTSAWFPLTFTAKCNKSLGRQKKDFFFPYHKWLQEKIQSWSTSCFLSNTKTYLACQFEKYAKKNQGHYFYYHLPHIKWIRIFFCCTKLKRKKTLQPFLLSNYVRLPRFWQTSTKLTQLITVFLSEEASLLTLLWPTLFWQQCIEKLWLNQST